MRDCAEGILFKDGSVKSPQTIQFARCFRFAELFGTIHCMCARVSKAKENTKKQENFVIKRKKTGEMLCDINSPIQRRILDKFLTDKQKTCGNRRMLRKTWTVHVSNEEFLRKMATKRKHALHQTETLEILRNIMSEDGLENLTLTGHI